MADKTIWEYPTLTEAQREDLILMASDEETYNMKVGTLLDAMGDVVNEKVDKTDIANNLTTTAAGKVLDARQGKVLNDAKLLLHEVIPDTVQSITFNGTTGNISTITHVRNGTTIRTDTFTFGTEVITEVRTLNTGESLTIVTNTTTLTTTVTYAA